MHDDTVLNDHAGSLPRFAIVPHAGFLMLAATSITNLDVCIGMKTYRLISIGRSNFEEYKVRNKFEQRTDVDVG